MRRPVIVRYSLRLAQQSRTGRGERMKLNNWVRTFGALSLFLSTGPLGCMPTGGDPTEQATGGTTTHKTTSTTDSGGTRSSGSTTGTAGSGGTRSSGGTSGTVGSGGTHSSGGTSGSGGTRSSGGTSGAGGTEPSGGSQGSGGTHASGGAGGEGGHAGSGGTSSTTKNDAGPAHSDGSRDSADGKVTRLDGAGEPDAGKNDGAKRDSSLFGR
jgi:hypothetical protein